jgi:SAM-dependent methyltransferase
MTLLAYAAGNGVLAVLTAGLMILSSRFGKLRARDRLLDGMAWRGDESVLDVGCGRGLLLPRRGPTPDVRAVGVDL